MDLMHHSLMVIDRFLENPDEVRAAGLNADYPDHRDISNFPGRNSQQRVNITGLEETIGNLVGNRLSPHMPSSHAKFRLTYADDVGRARVHLDSSQWSGILYLSKPEHCHGGTNFFKHKRTNTESMLLDNSQMESLGWHTPEQANREIAKIVETETNDASKWERTMTVSMQYNRLLLMRPWLWHTAGPGFGSNRENGRLVYLMFFNEVP